MAIDLLGFGIVIPLLPLYARHLGAGPASVGLLLAAFSAAQFAGAPILGRLSDRVGRKPLLIASLAGTAVASLLTGLAGSLWLLLVARVLDGASGGSVAVAQASAADLVGPRDRTRAFGLLGAAYGVGFVIGPAIGGLAALGGARLPFFIAAAIAGANAVVAVRRLPETRGAQTRRHPTREAEPAASRGLDPEPRRAPLSLRGALGTIAVPAVVTVLLVASFSAFEATFALFGQRRLGFGQGTVGAVFALVGVVSALVQGGLVHPLAARLGNASCLRLGLVAEALGLVLVPTAHTRLDLVLPLALVTVGQSLCTPALGALVAAKAPGGDYGTVLGVQQGLSSLARIIGPALGGLAFAGLGVAAPFVGAGLVVGAALIYSLVVRTSIRSSVGMVAEAPGIGYR